MIIKLNGIPWEQVYQPKTRVAYEFFSKTEFTKDAYLYAADFTEQVIEPGVTIAGHATVGVVNDVCSGGGLTGFGNAALWAASKWAQYVDGIAQDTVQNFIENGGRIF